MNPSLLYDFFVCLIIQNVLNNPKLALYRVYVFCITLLCLIFSGENNIKPNTYYNQLILFDLLQSLTQYI